MMFIEFAVMGGGVVYIRKDAITAVEPAHEASRPWFRVYTQNGAWPVDGTPDALFARMAGNDAEINTPAGDA